MEEESANVAVVRRAFAAFERRDLEALRGLCTEDLVFEPVTAQLAARAGEPYRGHEGLAEYFDDVAEIWQELRPQPRAFHEPTPGVVVVTGRIYGWGVGRVVDSPAGWLWHLREGRLAHGRVYESARAALADGGLA